MVTECRIKWNDDGSEMDVLICEYDEVPIDGDIDDNDIFYYGMSRAECLYAMHNNENIGDFRIVEVY